MRDPAALPSAHVVMFAGAVRLTLIGATLGLPVRAADEEQSPSIARLGFKFDQQAHDAAVAAEEKRRADLFGDAPPGVVRLPRYQVTEKGVPLTDDEMLTPKGKLEYAKKRYLAPLYQKTLGPLAAIATLLNNPLGGWAPNAPEAMALYEDEKQKQRNTRMGELTEIAALAERLKALEKAPPKAAPKK
ncbi:MAG TPA: hypothetical protein VNR00_00875 [Opitutus sp.]|nr:hypothetical protein [Opitutus sp.]